MDKFSLLKDSVLSVLQQITDPYSGKDLISAKVVREVQMNELADIHIILKVGYPILEPASHLRDTIIQVLKQSFPANNKISVTITWQVYSHTAQKGIKGIPGIKNIIAVASGKGGVGKSTTAVNLALAIQALGAKVGILDADIYGPSQPLMLGIHEKPEVIDNKKMNPVMSHGLQSMSMGYLVAEEAPMVWRGPMVSSALQQLLTETLWRDLDYLIVDLPPGTGDIQLTLAQKIPVAGVVIVTTPQDIALLDAKKALLMFKKLEINVLGIVENMSMHVCRQCGHQEPLFGDKGGQKMADLYDVPLLGQLPLDIHIRKQGDEGTPSVVADPLGEIALLYRDIAYRVTAGLSVQGRDYARGFPAVVLQNE